MLSNAIASLAVLVVHVFLWCALIVKGFGIKVHSWKWLCVIGLALFIWTIIRNKIYKDLSKELK